MKKHSDQKTGDNKEMGNQIENQSLHELEHLKTNVDFKQIEKDLNDRIMEVTLIIQDQHPELMKYLDEMPLTIPSDNDPEVTIKQLKSYHESLISIVNEYKQKYPKNEGEYENKQ